MTELDPRAAAAEAAALAFTRACVAGDDAAAQAACTDSGWNDGDDPCQRLFRQAKAKGMQVDPLGMARLFGDRAIQWTSLSHPSRPQPLGDLYLLLATQPDGAWKVEGLTKSRGQAALFLKGTLPGAFSVTELPDSAAAEAWSTRAVTALNSGELPDLGEGAVLVQNLLGQPGVVASPLRTADLPALGRAAAGLRFAQPGDEFGSEAWVILALEADGPKVLATRPWLDLDGLLTGLELGFPGRAGPEVQDKKDPRDAVKAAIAEALKASGAGDLPADDPRAQAAAKVLGMLDEIIGGSGGPSANDSTAAADADSDADSDADAPGGELIALPRRDPPPPAASESTPARDNQVTLPPGIQKALEDYISQQAAAGRMAADEVSVDSAFLRDHGPAVIGGMLGGFLQEVMPKDLELTVPVKGADGQPPAEGAPKQVKLKIDMGDILGKLFRPKAPSDAAPASPKPPEDPPEG